MPSSTSMAMPSMISCLGIAASKSLRCVSSSCGPARLGREPDQQRPAPAPPGRTRTPSARRPSCRRASPTPETSAHDAARAVEAAQRVEHAGIAAWPGQPREVARQRGVEVEPPDARRATSTTTPATVRALPSFLKSTAASAAGRATDRAAGEADRDLHTASYTGERICARATIGAGDGGLSSLGAERLVARRRCISASCRARPASRPRAPPPLSASHRPWRVDLEARATLVEARDIARRDPGCSRAGTPVLIEIRDVLHILLDEPDALLQRGHLTLERRHALLQIRHVLLQHRERTMRTNIVQTTRLVESKACQIERRERLLRRLLVRPPGGGRCGPRSRRGNGGSAPAPARPRHRPARRWCGPRPCVVTSYSRSISRFSASPRSMRCSTRHIQPQPSRHGVHWPQLSCL